MNSSASSCERSAFSARREAARLGGRRVPEQRHLAGGDLDDLDLVDALGMGERGRAAAAAPHGQLVLAVRLHARARAAASSSPSPWKTRSPTQHGRHVAHAGRPRGRGRGVQARPRPVQAGALQHRRGVHLRRGGGDQHGLALPEIAPRGECLAEGGERVGDHAADLLRVGRDEHRPLGVGGELRRPAHGHQPVGGGAALDVGAEDRLLLGAAKAARAADPHGHELRHAAEHVDDALGREIRVGRADVVVEHGRRHGDHSGRSTDITISDSKRPSVKSASRRRPSSTKPALR